MKIGILGVGNMGGAILMGGLKSAAIPSRDVLIYNRSIDKIQKFIDLGVQNAKDEIEVASKSDILILAVKPQNFLELSQKIKSYIKDQTVLVSIAAGLSLSDLENMFEHKKIIRVMPNTPALISQAMSAICRNENVSDEEYFAVKDIFEAIGQVAEIEESLFDAFSGISGCMPAYVFMFIEASVDAAVKNGLKRDEAYKYVAKAIAGSANLMLETGLHPAELKDQVTSPKGSTIRGVLALEREGFRNAIISAVDESSNYKVNWP